MTVKKIYALEFGIQAKGRGGRVHFFIASFSHAMESERSTAMQAFSRVILNARWVKQWRLGEDSRFCTATPDRDGKI